MRSVKLWVFMVAMVAMLIATVGVKPASADGFYQMAYSPGVSLYQAYQQPVYSYPVSYSAYSYPVYSYPVYSTPSYSVQQTQTSVRQYQRVTINNYYCGKSRYRAPSIYEDE